MNQWAFRHSVLNLLLNVLIKLWSVRCPSAHAYMRERGLSRAREVKRHVVRIGPEIKVARYELAAIVDPDRLRSTDLPTHAFERLHNIFAPIGEAWSGRWTEMRMGVDDRQDPQLLACR